MKSGVLRVMCKDLLHPLKLNFDKSIYIHSLTLFNEQNEPIVHKDITLKPIYAKQDISLTLTYGKQEETTDKANS